MNTQITVPRMNLCEYALANIFAEQRVIMIEFEKHENFKARLLNLAGKRFKTQHLLVSEIKQILLMSKSTEEFCISFIITKEFFRRLISLKRESSRTFNRTRFAEDFIMQLDSACIEVALQGPGVSKARPIGCY